MTAHYKRDQGLVVAAMPNQVAGFLEALARRVSLESGKRSSLSRRRRKSHECGLAAMEFRLKVDYENIKLRFTQTNHDCNRMQLCCKPTPSGARGQIELCLGPF
jgi:hypothetical protein